MVADIDGLAGVNISKIKIHHQACGEREDPLPGHQEMVSLNPNNGGGWWFLK